MMEYRLLGNTDVKVSLICLGTMTWGEQNTEDEAHQQMDYALDAGINFFDTAEMYPVPPRAETCHRTESYIGSWFAKRHNREKVILATKVSGPARHMRWIRDGQNRLDRKNIEQALNASLRRLQTDYIDLYQLHWPDRDTNCFGQLGYVHNPANESITIEETLDALETLVKAGKIRHIGLSNETPWGTMHFLELAKTQQKPRMVSIQNPYSLLNRSFEVGLAEIAIRENCGLLAYSPLAMGILSGKYLNDAKPEGARLTLFGYFGRYSSAETQEASKQYVALARQSGLNPAQMALAFVNTRPFLTSNIIGATTLAQLKENIDSLSVHLSPDVYTEIDNIHVRIPNPAP
jgi:aryl-alcohol dehydrogenase-like predicted oxidoreductase